VARSRPKDWILSALVLLLGRGRSRPSRHAERIVPRRATTPGAELAVLALLGLSSLSAIGFIVVYAVEAIPAKTQLLGLSLGLALLFLAAALVVAGKALVPEEELTEPYPPLEHPVEQRLVTQLVEEGVDSVDRRGLLKLGVLGAGGTLALAVITPALSFGPLFRTKDFYGTPWRRGRRLVDENERPLRADAIEQGEFYTAFPEGVDREELGSAVVVVRLPRGKLDLPSSLAGYDADGIVAYSAICTHAGCAISMYRVPTFPPVEPGPALVCPCHYSTFDPATGGTVIFGPAGRPLPMLPLRIDGEGSLRAAGNFDGAVGPSWWGVRLRGPNP
jgi:ubiquinol-cytochrome c reductase iron-sulfur subunit